MRAHAVQLSRARRRPVFDTCGTGGDRSGTFNISTAAALVVAACGVRVAKHGNRSVSSQCGSADVFEALGVNVDGAAGGRRALPATKRGIAFFFAPTFHPSMRHAAPARRELGVRTAFNLLGPLTNPAGAARQLVGVPRPELTELLARALLLLGAERAWVVHGADGLDEISTTGYTKVSECRDGAVHTFYVHPADFGLPKAAAGALNGGDAADERARSSARCSAARAGPAARRRAAERRRGAVRAGGPTSVRARHRDARRRGHRQRRGAARRSTGLRAVSHRGGGQRVTAQRARPARDDRRGDARARRGRGEAREPLAALERRARRARRAAGAFTAALRGAGGVNVIAECKRRSPSRGVLRRGLRPGRHRARLRSAAGAAAISVLTEPTFFDGRSTTSRRCARPSQLPLLRKDFIVDEYQLLEARAAGADAVLLIVAALDEAALDRAARARRGTSAWPRWSRCTTEDELDRARSTPAPHRRRQQPQPADAAVDIDASRATRGADARRRSIGVSESGLQTPARSRAAARRWATTRS